MDMVGGIRGTLILMVREEEGVVMGVGGVHTGSSHGPRCQCRPVPWPAIAVHRCPPSREVGAAE